MTGQVGRPKGGAKTGGRQKGTLNKNTQALNEWMQVKADELHDLAHPLIFLLETACDLEVPLDVRMDAAKATLPYVAKRAPTQIEHTGEGGDPIVLITNDAHQSLERLLFDSAEIVQIENEEAIDGECVEIV